MKVLGSLSAKWLIHFGAIEMTTTILLCYAIAVSLGHVKPWLPTISACGDHPPEEFFFRFGIFFGAMMLEVEAFALYLSKRVSSLTFTLGGVAAFCLGVVAVVGANEDNLVHTTSAVIFFVFEDIMSVFLTVDLMGKMSCCSLVTKICSCAVACTCTILRMLINGNLTVDDSFPALAIVEWSNTAAIVVFQLSLSGEIDSLFVGILESDSIKTTPKTPPTVITGTPLNEPPVYEVAGPLPQKKPVELVHQTDTV